MVSERTAGRLNQAAAARGIAVTVQASRQPKRRWYSVGNWHDGRWHQVTGFTSASAVEEFLDNYGTANS